MSLLKREMFLSAIGSNGFNLRKKSTAVFRKFSSFLADIYEQKYNKPRKKSTAYPNEKKKKRSFFERFIAGKKLKYYTEKIEWKSKPLPVSKQKFLFGKSTFLYENEMNLK